MITITPRDLAQRCAEGHPVNLIDVRTPLEFREVHVAFARNVPLDRLDPKELLKQGDGPLYVICRSGSRGKQACERLLAAGCTQVINIEGGTMACVEAGLPVVRGKKAISLQRQVQMTAGTLILLGAILAWFVHPGFVALCAIMGAGLLFTGITDNCAMGLFLAKMPWNRVATDATCGSS